MGEACCRNCGLPIRAHIPYEDRFCSFVCYVEHKDEDAEEPEMNGVVVLTNPFAWSR